MALGTPFTPLIRQRRNSTPDPATLARVEAAPQASPLDLVTAVLAPTAPIMPPFNGTSPAEVHTWVDTFEKVMIHHSSHLTAKAGDKHRASTFALYIARGTPAEIWWRGLGPAVQESWAQIRAVLNVKWVCPEPEVTKTLDYWRDFNSLKVTLDDLVRLIPLSTGGVRWGYRDWIDKVEAAGEASGSAPDVLIATVIASLLPADITNLVPPAAPDWPTFCAMVRSLLPETVKERVREAREKIAQREATALLLERTKEIEQRLAEQEQRHAARGRGYVPSQTPPPGYRPRDHSSSPRRQGDGWFFGAVPASNAPATPGRQRIPAQRPPSPTPSPTPLNMQRPLGSPAPIPTTPQRRPREQVPQTPGTLPGAVGCTRCGMGEHSQYTCMGKPLPEAEQRWREGERRRAYQSARGTYSAQQRTPHAQQLVDAYYYSDDGNSDYPAVYSLNDADEDDELDFVRGIAYGADQGNGDGVAH
ncbi:hypothetical protein AURDEDRAFT_174521 [Auricularia subglabra TFB-10046 SS5]|uniref:Uncharacterized protein n=1 Tax=Auricularia subglabra (strain TFB-10046 / SS5) TaxID=717982 RepID=J0CYL5_AURST|nr:hypothetical protein AURDEDRAFT_174521 [Auricularia subglabra TFB-10046 SS5]